MPANSPAKKNPAPRNFYVVVLAVVALGILSLLWMNVWMRDEPTPMANPAAPRNADKSDSARRAALPAAEISAAAAAASTAENPPAEPEANAQISYLTDDFRGLRQLPQGYKLENVKLTNQGITLGEAGSGGVRKGTIETPALTLVQPSNLVAPIWRQQLPAGTSVTVEVAISADNATWSPWYTSEPREDEIEPNYPDGRPNPHFGAISGSPFANGLKLSWYVRYRVTLASENAQSPVLQEIKIFHVDSTSGEGVPAADFSAQAKAKL